ncbi:helicase-related protein [Leucobacter sp. HY1910]
MSLPAAARSSLAALALLHTLPDGADLTDADRATLAAWTGWGPLAPALSPAPAEEWADAADQLEELLSPEAYAAAAEICDTSFFTPPVVAEAAFALLVRSGFTGGRVLEPGCGSGAIMSAAPADLPVAWTGIDRDPTAARLAQLQHPDARIIAAPLEQHHFPTGSFDAVIGNVPFARTAVYDPNFTGDTGSLHGYFTARALDAVKPGGYVVIITSRHFLDSIDQQGRDRAELVSAVRLPAGIFPGTDVVADIVVLRKPAHDGAERAALIPAADEQHATVAHPEPFHSVRVHALWGRYPALVAGNMTATGFKPAPLTVKARDRKTALAAALRAATALYEPEHQSPVGAVASLDNVPLHDADGRKEGSFHELDGAMHQVSGGILTLVARAGKELRALVRLRDAVTVLLALEADLDLPDSDLDPARHQALSLYETYVRQHGPIGRGTLTEGKPDPDTGAPTYTWRRPALGGFRKDPDYLTVLAAEQFDQATGEASPAPLLLRRVNRAPVIVDRAETPAEAARLAAGPGGVVDLDRAARLLGIAETEAAEALAGHGFMDEHGRFILAGDYLSGNIRAKLHAAEQAGLTRQAEALRQALPEPLGPLDIRAQIGATWIAPGIVESFLRDELRASGTVSYAQAVAAWEIAQGYCHNVDTNTRYGTPDVTPIRLLELALNNSTPVVYDELWEDGAPRRVKNAGRTIAAEEKQRALAERFEMWVWEDADRARALCDEFNRRFRSHRPRTGDGAHLTFPGLSEDITLWDHQKDAVDRILSDHRTILHHTVGAGKSLEMLAGAMKLKQLGLAQKPLITVPNHLLEQMAREARTAYPTGRFLIAGREEVTKDAKRLFAARCATGDWDAIIMTHTAFTSIPVSAPLEEQWIEEQKAELSTAAASIQRWESPRSQKKIAAAKRRLDTALRKLREDARRDPGQVTFEQLGVDHIAVDELHMFRRLMVTSTSQSGFSLGHSKRATDLALKIRSLSDRHPAKPVFAGFTGTLISNSLAEIFVWQTYTQPERLAEAGVAGFDAWAATFVKFETAVEVKPTGQGFHLKRRPRHIRNAAELASMLSETCDTVTAEQIGLERPTWTVHNIVSRPTEEQESAVAELSDRADLIYQGQVAPEDDNMLAICGEGRALALDPALVDVPGGSPTMTDAADQIAQLHRQHAARLFGSSPVPGMLQLVLCDLGTPKPGRSSSYGRLRALLADRGVPAARVRFVHEATTDKARAALFAQCRAGDVSVLIGSTAKVGVGTNIQTRLGAVHHLDAPWMPADVEQREGRALRPQNLAGHVDIFRYVTEGTFDALSWETLERKAKAVSGFLSAAADAREIDDITDVALSYGQVKALATGRPELLRLAEVSNDIRRLQLMRAVWSQQVHAATDRRGKLDRLIADYRRRGELISEALDRPRADDRTGRMYALAEAGREAYLSKQHSYEQRTSRRQWRGLDLALVWDPKQRAMQLALYHGYRLLDQAGVPLKTVRRGPDALARALTARADELIDALPGTLDRVQALASSGEQERGELDVFIAQAEFEREGELRALEEERRRIQQLLEESTAPAEEPALQAA